MYFLELHYTNGKVIRLPEPYILWAEAQEAAIKMTCAEYSVYVVQG